MRRSDEMPEDPFEDAGMEELSALLTLVRDSPSEEFARELDAKVARRFRPPATATSRAGRRKARTATRRRGWLWHPAFSAGLTAAVAAVVIVVAVHPGGSGTSVGGASSGEAGTARNGSATSAPRPAPEVMRTLAPSPPPNRGRQIDSAQLSLQTRGNRFGAVTQEILGVVDQEHGIVDHSQVTQGRRAGDRYASFRLGIPGSNMQATMNLLSRLRFARVISQTAASQNVSGRYQTDQLRLADARSLRATLLQQLKTAKTIGQADNLETRIHDVETSIAQREATLHALQHRISYSSLEIQVSQGHALPPAKHHGASGLTLRRALHDAVRVLVVAAAVVLIGLAAAIPVGLLAALLAWFGFRLRRRRREQTLDVA